MVKSSWFVALLILVAVLVCGGCAAIIGNQFAAPGDITATPGAPALMAEATLEPTATATPDGTIPTQQAMLNQIATSQADNNKLQEQIRQINLESQSLETRKIEAQAAIKKAEADKARAEADKAAQDAIIQDAKAKQLAESNRTKDIEAKSLIATAEIKQAETADNMQWIIGGGIIGILALGVIAMFRNRPQTETSLEQPTESDNDKFLRTMTPPTQITNSEGTAGFEHVVNITREEWFVLRRAAVALSGLFSRRKLTGEYGGEKYFTEPRAREILTILQTYDADNNRYGQPHTNDTTLLTEYGWKWLKLTPTSPPPDDISANSAEITVKIPPTPPHNTEGEAQVGE